MEWNDENKAIIESVKNLFYPSTTLIPSLINVT